MGVLFLLLFIYYLCVCVYMEAREQLLGVSSVILLFVLGIKSGRQAWQQGALPPEPSRWPHPLVLNSLLCVAASSVCACVWLWKICPLLIRGNCCRKSLGDR